MRRASTQIELIAVADAVKAQGKPEVAALLAAAVQEGPEPRALKKLEAHYVARGAWRDLAQLYRQTAAQAASRAEKVDTLEKLAELLESELHDAVGAAKVYANLVALGDARAVAEQVRLLNLQKDSLGVRAALDESVSRAVDPRLRADALVMRADDALARPDLDAARRDYEEALKLAPFHPAAAAGLAELAVHDGRREPLMTFAAALKAMPKRKSGRAELYRRLGRLADNPFHDARLAREAWSEVVLELRGDEEALGRLSELSRQAGDDVQLETVLKTQLEREPRGARARKAHLELVALLEKGGRKDEALEALKAAVRFEPGNRDAWLALSDRYLQAGQAEEAVWALEHGATATESGSERMRLWLRLARLAREQLQDVAKADAFEARADKLKRELAAELPEGPLGGRLDVPRPPLPRALRPSPPKANPWDEIAAGIGAQREELLRPPRPLVTPSRGRALGREGAPEAAGMHKPLVFPEAELARGAVRALDADEPSGKHGLLLPPNPALARAKTPVGVTPVDAAPPQPRIPPGRVDAGAETPVDASPPTPRTPSGRFDAVGDELVPPRRTPSGRLAPVQDSSGRVDSGKVPRAPVPVGVSARVDSGKVPRVQLPPDVGARVESGKVPRAPVADEPPRVRVGGAASLPRDQVEDFDDEVSVEEALRGDDDVVEVGTADIELPSAEWVAPPGELDDDLPRKTAEVPLETGLALGDPSAAIPPSLIFTASKAMSEERKAIFERVRAAPLESEGYRLLADHFDHAGDPTRQSLMLEIARALEGDPNAAPRAPKLILSATDGAGLKHPSLRGPSGELFGLAGAALCRLYPARAGQREELRLDSGKGAKAAADALLAAVRMLGLRAPDVFLSEDNGPPFSLIHTTEPKLLVGQARRAQAAARRRAAVLRGPRAVHAEPRSAGAALVTARAARARAAGARPGPQRAGHQRRGARGARRDSPAGVRAAARPVHEAREPARGAAAAGRRAALGEPGGAGGLRRHRSGPGRAAGEEGAGLRAARAGAVRSVGAVSRAAQPPARVSQVPTRNAERGACTRRHASSLTSSLVVHVDVHADDQVDVHVLGARAGAGSRFRVCTLASCARYASAPSSLLFTSSYLCRSE